MAERMVWCLSALLLLGSNAYAQDSSFFESFGNGIGRSMLAIAWPTATYTGVNFVGAEAGNGLVYATFRLYGKSAFDGSELWTDCIVTLKGLEVINVRFGRNNGVVPPGLTAGMLTEALRDLQKQANEAQQSSTQVWTVADKCSDKQGLYVRFHDFKSKLVWDDGKTPFLVERGQTRTFYLTVKPDQEVCYGARPPHSTKRYWGVGLSGTKACDSCCYTGPNSNIRIDLTCD
jgi:hypothetical protein